MIFHFNISKIEKENDIHITFFSLMKNLKTIQIEIILTPVNTELKSISSEELCKYTSSPLSNYVAADTEAPFACGLVTDDANDSSCKFL